MKGFSIKGAVQKGDWLEVEKIKDGGRVKSLVNLTTDVRVKTKLF